MHYSSHLACLLLGINLVEYNGPWNRNKYCSRICMFLNAWIQCHLKLTPPSWCEFERCILAKFTWVPHTVIDVRQFPTCHALYCPPPPMSLRRCEWRVCGRGQTTSKPSIHIAPSYGLRNCSGKPQNNLWRTKNQCLQDDGVDCSSPSYESISVGFWRFPKGSSSSQWSSPPTLAIGKLGNPLGTIKIPYKCSNTTGYISIHFKVGH